MSLLRIIVLINFVSIFVNDCLAETVSPFCKRNPEARVCITAPDVARKEKEALEEECIWRPNTERCKNKATREKVQQERLDFCAENPKKCAAKRVRK